MIVQMQPRCFFTGKPLVGELGYAFLMRNYRSDTGKWQTSDPLGYPDGWNNYAYCNNNVGVFFDFAGAKWVKYYDSGAPTAPASVTSSKKFIRGEDCALSSYYSTTSYSWTELYYNDHVTKEDTITVTGTRTITHEVIKSYADTVENSVSASLGAKGGFSGVAEFSSQITTTGRIASQVSGSRSLAYIETTQATITKDFKDIPADEYWEWGYYQLNANTNYYESYVPPSDASEPLPAPIITQLESFDQVPLSKHTQRTIKYRWVE